LKKRLLSDINLYLILNITNYRQHNLLFHRAQRALETGVQILQLRCKDIKDCIFLDLAYRLRKLTQITGTLFIVNDRADIAFSSNADGVHLGQSDLPVAVARRILGKDKIIGKSTRNLKQALQAQSEMVDYIGFGPVFKTQTKPNIKATGIDPIRLLIGKIKIPCFVLGGIDQNNIKGLIQAGVGRVAVSSAILSKKATGQAVKNLQRELYKRTSNLDLPAL